MYKNNQLNNFFDSKSLNRWDVTILGTVAEDGTWLSEEVVVIIKKWFDMSGGRSVHCDSPGFLQQFLKELGYTIVNSQEFDGVWAVTYSLDNLEEPPESYKEVLREFNMYPSEDEEETDEDDAPNEEETPDDYRDDRLDNPTEFDVDWKGNQELPQEPEFIDDEDVEDDGYPDNEYIRDDYWEEQ